MNTFTHDNHTFNQNVCSTILSCLNTVKMSDDCIAEIKPHVDQLIKLKDHKDTIFIVQSHHNKIDMPLILNISEDKMPKFIEICDEIYKILVHHKYESDYFLIRNTFIRFFTTKCNIPYSDFIMDIFTDKYNNCKSHISELISLISFNKNTDISKLTYVEIVFIFKNRMATDPLIKRVLEFKGKLRKKLIRVYLLNVNYKDFKNHTYGIKALNAYFDNYYNIEQFGLKTLYTFMKGNGELPEKHVRDALYLYFQKMYSIDSRVPITGRILIFLKRNGYEYTIEKIKKNMYHKDLFNYLYRYFIEDNPHYDYLIFPKKILGLNTAILKWNIIITTYNELPEFVRINYYNIYLWGVDIFKKTNLYQDAIKN